MKAKKIIATVTLASLIGAYAVSFADAEKIAAFPGAEGGGMYTTGARDTVKEVYHVTTLADNGKVGTLRDAVSKSDRIIVFDVAGNIELTNALNITGDNLTILGQTAPGDGICIKNNSVGIYGDNVILRYLRFRMGDEATVENDTIGARDINNVILDHCSISWSTDECASFYDNTNFTMQWCIISESLKESVHAKGSHGYGGIWGGRNASFHHNLIMSHDSRNPRIATAGIDAAYNDVTKQVDLTDLRNNVIYNWGGNSAYGGENGAPVNIVNCYYKAGPATKHKSRIFEISAKAEGDTTGTNELNRPGWGTDLYVSGNYVDGYADVTADNTMGVVTDSNAQKYSVWTDSNITDDEKTVHNRYAADYPVTTQTAQEAYESVLSNVGASIVRDSVDARLIEEVKTGTATYGTGIINSPSEVGGYPVLSGTKAKDSDNDGIPNEWEDNNGLDKFDASDSVQKAQSGYLYVEEYANALADGSYVRNVDYDPEVEDYNPEIDSDATPEPSAEPEKELISSWTAAKGDEAKPAGSEFMPGLTNVVQLNKTKTDTVKFSEELEFKFAITSDETAGWNSSTKKAKGNALRFEAPQDGIFTLYAYTVSGTKTFYVVPEGVSNPKSEYIYSQEYTGAAIPILYSVEMKEGDVYYFYIDGSKARFCGAKFEVYKEVESTPEPTTEPTASPEPTMEATSSPEPTTEPTSSPEPYEKYFVSELNAGSDSVTFTVTSNDYSEGGVAIVAYYDDNGRLSATKSITINENNTYIMDRGVADNESISLMIWNSIDEMLPIAKVTK